MVFAIGLENIDLEETKDIFKIIAVKVSTVEGYQSSEILELTKCKK